jgi:hypothetical protein
MALVGDTQLRPVNFLESYARGLELGAARQGLEQEQLQRIKAAEQERTLNELYAQSMGAGGQVDPNALMRGMAQRGLGAQIPAFQAQQAKIAQDLAQARKAEAEVRPAEWKQFREELAALPAGDQARYQAWANRVLSRAPWAIDFLAPVFNDQTKRQMLTTADAALPKGEVRDIGGGVATIDPFTGNQIGTTIANIPDPEAVVQSKERVARAGAPTTVIGGAGAFGKAIATGGGEEIVKSREQASSALASINNIQSLLPLVSSPEFISGTLGDARLAVAKALNLPGATETQTYFSGIGRDVAEIIKAFGAGTGLSDADREFAKGIAGGDIKLTAPAIRKILWLNANYNNQRINRYNQRVAEIAANPLTDEATKQQLAVLHGPIEMANVGPRPVMSKDEARLLPPGTEFVMPDGAVYRVPQKKK